MNDWIPFCIRIICIYVYIFYSIDYNKTKKGEIVYVKKNDTDTI